MKESFVVSVDEMRKLDRLTMEEKGITSFELMMLAGSKMEEYLIESNMIKKNDKVVVVIGTGNNGGDGLVIAKRLKERGLNPSVVLVGDIDSQTEESKNIWEEIQSIDITNYIVNSKEKLDLLVDVLQDASIVIDAVFGIGLTRDVEGVHKSVIDRINDSSSSIISIDIPSGINATNGLVCGVAVHANRTIVVEHYKQGNILGDALDYSGEIHLLSIGISNPKDNVSLLQKEKITLLPLRKRNTHKYHYGCVLTIGGSKGMMGAPILSGLAVLKTGSGLSKVMIHENYMKYSSSYNPSLMVDTYKDITDIDFSRVSGIIYGPGLGRKDKENTEYLRYLIGLNKPLLIDADGLHYLTYLLDDITLHKNVVVTPHYGEMALLMNVNSDMIRKNPTKFAHLFTKKYGGNVVLKGSTTIITDGHKTVYSCLGNPGLATAGSGDVLSGVIGSLIGRGINGYDASTKGVYIHSKAGLIAKEIHGEESMIATDIIESISNVLK